MKLQSLQALMMAAIRHPTGVRDFLAEASADQRDALQRVLVSPPGSSAAARLNIYAESYFWRLLEVLQRQYRTVAWLAGPAPFRNAITDYVWAHPSRGPDVRRIGLPLPEFLDGHPLAQRVPGIAALARVERAIGLAMDAPDCACLRQADLMARPTAQWPTMRLVAAPWVALLRTRHPYPRLFAAAERGDDPRDEACAEIARAAARPVHRVLVWRHQLEVFHRSVAAAEARALAAMLEGATFERICAAAADPDAPDPAGPTQVVQWLHRWLDASLIVGVASDTDPKTVSSD